MLIWLGVNRVPRSWDIELAWAAAYAKGRSVKAEMYRMALAAIIYHLWRERNTRIFQQKQQPVERLVKMIIQEIHARGIYQMRVATWLEEHNYYPA